MLPPATVFGSTCDMQQLFLDASAAGFLHMPYSNPTWWDVNSPTLKGLVNMTGSLLSGTAWNSSYQPIWETYDDKPTPRSGVVVAQRSQFVLDAINRLLPKLSWNTSQGAPPMPCVEETAQLPSTYVFEDQVGARFPSTDYCPSENGLGAFGYEVGLQQHSEAHASVGLHTEQGFDRLIPWYIGFHGTILNNLDTTNPLPPMWVKGAWRSIPLFAASGLRGLVEHYQHNLEGTVQARTMSLLCFSFANGIHLSLDLGNAAAIANTSWTSTVTAFQRILASRFADADVISLQRAADGQSSSVLFSQDVPLDPVYSTTYNVTWSSDGGSPLELMNPSSVSIVHSRAISSEAVSTIAPGGCAGGGNLGDAAAGFFVDSFNGYPLTGSGQVHAIFEDATCDVLAPPAGPSSLCVLHTLGPDTNLTVALPNALQGISLTVSAINATGAQIANIPSTLANGGTAISFFASALVQGMNVFLYSIHK
jgi:hypothetical protein